MAKYRAPCNHERTRAGNINASAAFALPHRRTAAPPHRRTAAPPHRRTAAEHRLLSM
jgi:hypothetical protein